MQQNYIKVIKKFRLKCQFYLSITQSKPKNSKKWVWEGLNNIGLGYSQVSVTTPGLSTNSENTRLEVWAQTTYIW